MISKSKIKNENLSMLINKFGIDMFAAKQLQKLAKSLHRSHENECNYGLTPRQETRERNLWKNVEAIAERFSFCAQEQGDPRGWPIMLDGAPIQENLGSSYDRVCPF